MAVFVLQWEEVDVLREYQGLLVRLILAISLLSLASCRALQRYLHVLYIELRLNVTDQVGGVSFVRDQLWVGTTVLSRHRLVLLGRDSTTFDAASDQTAELVGALATER